VKQCPYWPLVKRSHRTPQKKPPGSLYGRSRGGLTTKIHALTDARGLPLELVLTPGQAGDCRWPRNSLAICARTPSCWPRQGLRCRLVATADRGGRRGPQHPADGASPLEAVLQPGALPRAQPHRALLQPHQTLPPACHALRKARRKLPCHAQAGCGPTLAAP